MNFKFETRFTKLTAHCAGAFSLRGSTLLVEIAPVEEIKTASGLIVATDKQQVRGGIEEHRIIYGKVLLSGEGYYNSETNENTPCDIQPGAIVLLPKFGVSYISVFPGMKEVTGMRLGFVKEADVLFFYKDVASFVSCQDVLNEEPAK